MAAMMAHKCPPETVFDKPGGAVRAVKTMSTCAAEGQRRVAPPVEKQERLFAKRERLCNGLIEPWRDPCSAQRRLGAKIDRRDRGRRLRIETGGEAGLATGGARR